MIKKILVDEFLLVIFCQDSRNNIIEELTTTMSPYLAQAGNLYDLQADYHILLHDIYSYPINNPVLPTHAVKIQHKMEVSIQYTKHFHRRKRHATIQ